LHQVGGGFSINNPAKRNLTELSRVTKADNESTVHTNIFEEVWWGNAQGQGINRVNSFWGLDKWGKGVSFMERIICSTK